jgi:thioredoxin 2
MSIDTFVLRCDSCSALNRVPVGKLGNHPICGKCKTSLHVPKKPVDVTESTFEREVSTWPGTVLVEFRDRWCRYCQLIEPALDDLAEKRAGRLKIVKIDIHEEQTLANRFGVHATPTFILFQKGRQLARLDGSPKGERELEEWILQVLMKQDLFH